MGPPRKMGGSTFDVYRGVFVFYEMIMFQIYHVHVMVVFTSQTNSTSIIVRMHRRKQKIHMIQSKAQSIIKLRIVKDIVPIIEHSRHEEYTMVE